MGAVEVSDVVVAADAFSIAGRAIPDVDATTDVLRAAVELVPMSSASADAGLSAGALFPSDGVPAADVIVNGDAHAQ